MTKKRKKQRKADSGGTQGIKLAQQTLSSHPPFWRMQGKPNFNISFEVLSYNGFIECLSVCGSISLSSPSGWQEEKK